MLKEFETKFGRHFRPYELEEIRAHWGDEARNVWIIGIFDRRYRGRSVRAELLDWLDRNPDKVSIQTQTKTSAIIKPME